MKKLSVLTLFAIIGTMIGCTAPVRKVALNGYLYPTKRFATVEEVSKKVAEDLVSVKTDMPPTIVFINSKYLDIPADGTYMTMKGEWDSIVGAKLIFNKRVETIRIRNGNDEKNWIRDVFQPALKADPLLIETCKKYWTDAYSVTRKEKQNLYTTEDMKNISVVTDSAIIGVKYTPEAEKLKEGDNCSIKSAELYMVKLAREVASRTEEYINK